MCAEGSGAMSHAILGQITEMTGPLPLTCPGLATQSRSGYVELPSDRLLVLCRMMIPDTLEFSRRLAHYSALLSWCTDVRRAYLLGTSFFRCERLQRRRGPRRGECS